MKVHAPRLYYKHTNLEEKVYLFSLSNLITNYDQGLSIEFGIKINMTDRAVIASYIAMSAEINPSDRAVVVSDRARV